LKQSQSSFSEALTLSHGALAPSLRENGGGHRLSIGTSYTDSSLGLRNGQARFGKNAVNDFFSAIVVLRMYSAAPASEFAAQELGLASGGIVLALSVKRFQYQCALFDETVDRF
jgi:hypothetical protein